MSSFPTVLRSSESTSAQRPWCRWNSGCLAASSAERQFADCPVVNGCSPQSGPGKNDSPLKFSACLNAVGCGQLLLAGSQEPRQRQEADLRVAGSLAAKVSSLARRWRPGIGQFLPLATVSLPASRPFDLGSNPGRRCSTGSCCRSTDVRRASSSTRRPLAASTG